MTLIKLKKFSMMLLFSALIFGVAAEGCISMGFFGQATVQAASMNTVSHMPMHDSMQKMPMPPNQAGTEMLCCTLSVDQNMPAAPFQLFGSAGFWVALITFLFLSLLTKNQVFVLLIETPPHIPLSPVREHTRINC